MAKIYWTSEVRKIMSNLIHNELDLLLDPGMDSEKCSDRIFDIREHRKFADDVLSVMEALDKQDEEERAERERQEENKDAAGGS